MLSGRSRLPSRLVVVAGTYDGVLAGWDTASHDEGSSRDGDDEAAAAKLRGGMVRRMPLKNASDADEDSHLKMNFAMAVHEGSVRCLSISSAPSSAPRHGQIECKADDGDCVDGDDEQNAKKRRRKKRRKSKGANDGEAGEQEEASRSRPRQQQEPGTLLSAGYDDAIAVYNLTRHVQSGELKSPADLGTPTCSSFAPPAGVCTSPATHALVGMSSGKIVLYKKRDWTVQHVLSGHDGEHGGVNCVAVHPSGRMALSGGRGDGRIVLWDLTKGRLAFVHKLPPQAGSRGRRKTTVTDLAWSADGNRYAFATDGGKVTARDVATGEDLLDVMLPSRANQIDFVGGTEGLFLAAACDDGSLPVLAVGSVSEEDDEEGGEGGAGTRRAIMAIEPVDGPVAGNDRFKCLRCVKGGSGFLVVTANSGGVISVIDLEGAARMILSDDDDEERGGKGPTGEDGKGDIASSDDDDDDEVAAEFLESVRVGSGARITSLAVWSSDDQDSESLGGNEEVEVSKDVDAVAEEESDREAEREEDQGSGSKRKASNLNGRKSNEVEMDSEAVAKARALVSQAKKRQKRAKQKESKKSGAN